MTLVPTPSGKEPGYQSTKGMLVVPIKPNLTLMHLHEQLQANRAEINALIRKENAILDQIAKLEAIE